GLASLGSVLGLGKLAGSVEDTTTRVTSSVKDSLNDVRSETTRVEDDTYEDDNEGGGFMKWLLPLLGIIAALALLYFLMKQCDSEKVEPTDDTEVIQDADDAMIDA